MNREMTVFAVCALLLGGVLLAGMQLEPRAQRLPSARGGEECAVDWEASAPTSEAVRWNGERRNPFAPPGELTWRQPRDPGDSNVAIDPIDSRDPNRRPIPPVVAHRPPPIQAWSPAEIPVAFIGRLAVPGQAECAQLRMRDGSQRTVRVGDRVAVAAPAGGYALLRIVALEGGDVIVERNGERVGLRGRLAGAQ